MVIASKYKGYGSVSIQETGCGYDFIAVIVNDSEQTLNVYVDDLEGWYSEPLVVKPYNWQGILADDEGEGILSMIKDGDFKAVLV